MNAKIDLDTLAARVSEFISRADLQIPEEDNFNSFALDLFRLQRQLNQPYSRFCHTRDVSPDLTHWSQILPVPTAAFKELDLSCLPAVERITVFHSSGTTAHRASHHFHNEASLSIYEASVWHWFEAHLIRSYPRPARLIVLTPPIQAAPRSSLVYMFGTVLWELSKADPALIEPDRHYYGQVNGDGTWALETGAVIAALQETQKLNQPVMVLGTAFLFLHLLDELAARKLTLQLPPGSRAMETGGYKGRSRTLAKTELHALIAQKLGIPLSHIVSEYGMSELSSQAYDTPARSSRSTPHASPTSPAQRVFRFPPWVRVQIISPESGKEVDEGETGLIRVFDLANVYSVMAIQTEDLGIRRGNRFEILGRATQAEPRGCSLMAQ